MLPWRLPQCNLPLLAFLMPETWVRPASKIDVDFASVFMVWCGGGGGGGGGLWYVVCGMWSI